MRLPKRALLYLSFVLPFVAGCSNSTDQATERAESKQPRNESASQVEDPGSSVSHNDKKVHETKKVVVEPDDKDLSPKQLTRGQIIGRSPSRNNVAEGNIPADWDAGRLDRKTGKWEKSRNIKWAANLGSQTHGGPVVADGRIFVGTNNGAGYLKRYPYQIDLGVLLCFRESDGKFLWQHSNEKLPTGRVHDWDQQGVWSTPLVEGKRLWYVTNRGEVVCLDSEGFHDGEDDGPIRGEPARLFNVPSGIRDDDSDKELEPTLQALAAGRLSDHARAEFARLGFELPADLQINAGDQPHNWSFSAKLGDSERKFFARKEGPKLAFYAVTTPNDKQEADVIWRLDMMKQLGVSQLNKATCAPAVWGDVLFICTSNGVDESHLKIPAPEAPSFIALDKNTGEVLWTDRSPGGNIMSGQWSSPAIAVLGGVPQVIFPGGDGWIYSFRADAWDKKRRRPIRLWRFDANPKESIWGREGRGTRNNIIAIPVIHQARVYVTTGVDPQWGLEGPGCLWCIDPTRRGDVSPQLAMRIHGDHKVPIAHRGRQAVNPEKGEVAVDNPNSAVVWKYNKFDQNRDGKIQFEETFHRSVSNVAIKDNLLFTVDYSGLVHCLDAEKGKIHWTYDLFAQAWSSPLIAGGRVFICDEDGDVALFALSAEAFDPLREINMGSSVNTTPVVANNVLYIASRSYLFAIEETLEVRDD